MASVDYHGSDPSLYAQDDIISSSYPHVLNHLDSNRSAEDPATQASSLGSAYSNPSGPSLDNQQYNIELHRTGSNLDADSYPTEPSSALSKSDTISPYGASPNEYSPDNSTKLDGSLTLGMGSNGYDIDEEEARVMATHDGVEVQPELDNYVEDVVQPGFDEAILRALCDMDVGVPLLLDRIKQSMTSCREASIFLKKRAQLEDEYGKNLSKLARQSSEVYAMTDGKAGTFVGAWHSSMKIHEIIGENRVKFAARLLEMSEELTLLTKEVEKNRKGTKDLHSRYERVLQESEAALEKHKSRHDVAADDLQRFLLSKEGESAKDAGMPSSTNSKANKRAIGKAVAKGGFLLKGRNPANLQRHEEDVRSRVSTAAEALRKAVQETQGLRQEYFNFQLPRILRALKECADEIDLGLQYHLSRYAFLMESTALSDGSVISPSGIEDGPGIKAVIGSIDNQTDFKTYMQNYAVSHAPTGPRRQGPWEEGFLPPLPSHNGPLDRDRISTEQQSYLTSLQQTPSPSQGSNSSPSQPLTQSQSQSQFPSNQSFSSSQSTTNAQQQPPGASQQLQQQQSGRASASDNRARSTPSSRGMTFGVSLAEQMMRDAVEVPKVLEKCCEVIKHTGSLDTVGIYRLSGITSKVRELKAALDRDIDSVDLMAPEWSSDINNVTSTLKLWFRELPEPLMTYSLYTGFIEAAKIENDRLRHIRLHEKVNELPDPNYATLKYLMAHLHEVSERSHVNQMHASNLSIVFGPTLLGPPPHQRSNANNTNGSSEGGNTLADMNLQCKAVETILEHYRDIFVDESEETQPS